MPAAGATAPVNESKAKVRKVVFILLLSFLECQTKDSVWGAGIRPPIHLPWLAEFDRGIVVRLFSMKIGIRHRGDVSVREPEVGPSVMAGPGQRGPRGRVFPFLLFCVEKLYRP